MSNITYDTLYPTNYATLASCLKIILTNGKILAFTTHVESMRFLEEPDVIYSPVGFMFTAVSKSSDMSVDNVNVTITIDSERILEDDLEKGYFNNAYFEYFDIDYTKKNKRFYTKADRLLDLGQNGVIGEVQKQDNQYSVEFRSMYQYFTPKKGKTIGPGCQNFFGDSNCKKDLTSLTFVDTVASVFNNHIFTITNDTHDDDFYKNGTVEILSTENIGVIYSIKKYDSINKQVHLQERLLHKVNVGDEVRLIAGCAKNTTDCKKYSNMRNYGGFPYIPGNDAAIAGV